MANTVEEMTCRSIDAAGFEATADDAWFDAHTAPMDGEDETGAHPYQAKALKAYINGESNAADTAAILTKPKESESLADVQDRVFGLIEAALVELPDSVTPALIELLKTINQLEGEVGGQPAWKGLRKFGDSWSDSWKQSHWRKALATVDPGTRAQRRKAIVHRAYVEASCAVAITEDGEDGVLLPLDWGYECLSDTLECQDALYDFDIPAVAVWIKIAGKRFKEGAEKGETSWALEREGRLWKAGPMSTERWTFWVNRLDEAVQVANITSAAAKDAMAAAESTTK